MTDFELDAQRMLCPMPVIRTQDRIKELNPGDRLKVICTDPGAKNDIPAWCRINGHRVDDIIELDGTIEILITVGQDG
ncbi:MAG: sulfurtransferase TusA family protein [Acidiferrobacterales bacterium]|nr:sulfurtransferase TusA family protein [Acidiferrobacterales bacterium]